MTTTSVQAALEEAAAPSAAKTNLSGIRKAAVLLVLLGDEAASAVYRHLPQEELHRLTEEIASLQPITPETAHKVLEEYYQLTVTQEYLSQGGPSYAHQLLVKAFGEEGAKSLLQKVMQDHDEGSTNLESLKKFDPEQLVKFIEGEHPQTVALVLAHLGVKPAATTLALLPEKLRIEAVKRVAEMQSFSTDHVKKISLILHKRLAALGEQSRRAHGGIKAVADILNRLDPNAIKEILEAVEQADAQLALAIRNFMFTFEDLLGVPANSLRELLAQVDKKIMSLALKGASEQLKSHIYTAMSQRAAQMLKEDMEALGPMRMRQVQQAQQEVVQVARKLEAAGKLALKNSDEDSYMV